MDRLRGRYRISGRHPDLQVGATTAVFSQTFVARSLRREPRRDDGLNGMRGMINAILISAVFWVAIGAALFAFS